MLVHLMLELYGCSREVLTDEPLIQRVLDEYPGHVDMEKVSPVHLYRRAMSRRILWCAARVPCARRCPILSA